MRLPTLALFMLPIFFACAKTSPSDICARRAATTCSYLYNCCDGLERYQLTDLDSTNPGMSLDLDNGFGFIVQVNNEPTQGGCEESLTAQCNAALAYLNAAAEEKRVTVDEAAVDECLKPLETALDACEPNAFFNYALSDQDACEKMISGTVVGGGDCYSAAECVAEGSFCDMARVENPQPNTPETRKLQGVCKAPPQLGQDCDNGQCAPSLYCDTATMKCASRIGLNGNCAMGICQDDLYCDGPSMTCRQAAGSGQACGGAMNIPCARDLNCQNDVCRPNNTPAIHQYCDGV